MEYIAHILFVLGVAFIATYLVVDYRNGELSNPFKK